MESAEGVRSVREGTPNFPHLLTDGTLVIRFGSAERFHWWNGGQSISETLREIRSPMFEIQKEVQDGATI